MIKVMEQLPYQETKRLGFFCLEKWLRGDMKDIYTIMKCVYKMNRELLFIST